MNANSVNIFGYKPQPRLIELVIYALLSIGLIGHTLVIHNQMTLYNVVLLGIGTLFGLMFAVGCTPLSLKSKRVKTKNVAKVLSFNGNAKPTATGNDHNKHAA